MQEITFQDKEFVNEQTSIPDVNKVKDSDLNEIKHVVNTNKVNTVTTQEISDEDLENYEIES